MQQHQTAAPDSTSPLNSSSSSPYPHGSTFSQAADHQADTGNPEPQNPTAGLENDTDGCISQAFRYVDQWHREKGVWIVSELIKAHLDGQCDKSRMAELSGQVEALKNQIGPSILYGIVCLPPQDRAIAPCAVEQLGRYMDGWTEGHGWSAGLSGLGLAVFVSYHHALFKEDVTRFSLGFYQSFLPEEERNVSHLCSYLGCGVNQAGRGHEEYRSQPFNWGTDRTRQPGAGAPSVHDQTSETLYPAVAAVFGIADGDKEDQPEPDPSAPAGAEKEDVPAEGKEEPAGKGGKDDPSEIHTFETILESVKGLDDAVARAKALLAEAGKHTEKKTERKYLVQVGNMIDLSWSFINTSVESIGPCLWQDTGAGDGKAEEGTGGQTAIDLSLEMEKLFKIQMGSSSLDGLQKNLRAVCEQLQKIFTPTDSDDIRHQQIKDAMFRIPKGVWWKRIMKEIQACVNLKLDAHRLSRASFSSLVAWGDDECQEGSSDLISHLARADLKALKDKLTEAIGFLTAKLEAIRDKEYVREAFGFLRNMEMTMDTEIHAEHLNTETPDLKAALLILLLYALSKVADWKKRLEPDVVPYPVLHQVCAEVDQISFRETYERWIGDYRAAVVRDAAIAEEGDAPVLRE